MRPSLLHLARPALPLRLALFLVMFVGRPLFAANPAAETLLTPVSLGSGTQTTVVWTELSSLNSGLAPASGSGSIAVNSPGFRAGAGFYSYAGDYSATVATSAAFTIRSVVLQLVGMTVSGETAGGEAVDYDAADHLAFNGGPVLTYTHAGGVGTLAPTTRGTLAGPLAGAGAGFTGDYYSFAWQWDLSALPETVTGVSIHAPLRAHSSTVGARLDVGSAHATVVGAAPAGLLQIWRQTHFATAAAEGDAADSADPDADGVPNLLEYALDRDPRSADSGPSRTLALDGDRLALGFVRVADPALRYAVEATDDLAAAVWPEIWTSTGSANTAGPVVVADSEDLAAAPRRFLRLVVTLP